MGYIRVSETTKDFANRVASMDFNSSQAKRVLVSELEKRDTAAERRGFIRGLEAARRVARKENGFYLPLDVAAAVARVGAAITARIKREKAKR